MQMLAGFCKAETSTHRDSRWSKAISFCRTKNILSLYVMDMVYTSNLLSSIFISFNRRAKKIAQC